MSLRLEEIKIVPSVLQEQLDNDTTVIVKCDMIVPNNIDQHKTFKINIKSASIKTNIPNVQRWFNDNDHSVFQSNKKYTLQKSTVYNCFLNFPIDKIIRGIHPNTLETNRCGEPTVEMTDQYTWDEQLESWLSLYDVEISSYCTKDTLHDYVRGHYNNADDTHDAYGISDDLLVCNTNFNDDLVLVEYKRVYRDQYKNEHVEYLYYLTFSLSFDKEFIKSAMDEYSELFNMGTTPSFTERFSYIILKK